MSRLICHIKQTALEDTRLFMSPFAGALREIKAELGRPKGENLRQIIVGDMRLFFAPFVGAVAAIKSEFTKNTSVL